MSDEPVRVDGVTVEKGLDTDEFPVPTVTFELASEREAPATVRVVDRVPEAISMDQVGFHPDYDSEKWTAYPDNRVEFETELGPGASVTTVYGVQLQDVEADQFDAAPDLTAEPVGELSESEASDPVDGSTMSDIASRDDTDVVRDVIGGERDTVPGLDDEEDEADPIAVGADGETDDVLGGVDDGANGETDAVLNDVDDGDDGETDDILNDVDDGDDGETGAVLSDVDDGDDGETGDSVLSNGDDTLEADGETGAVLDDADGDDAPSGVAEDPDAAVADEAPGEEVADGADGAGAGGAAAAAPTDPGDVAAALAEAVREDAVAEEDLAVIAGALGRTRSSAVELDQLHGRVGELEAYTDAMAEFIDENGTATELLERVEGDLDALDERVAATEDDVDAAATEHEELRTALADVEADIETLRGDLDALDERVAATEDDVTELDDVEDGVEDLEDDIEELREWRDQLSDVFGA